MPTDRQIVSLIEQALDAHPYCAACGTHNTVTGNGLVFTLQCAAPAQSRRLGRALAAFRVHERRTIADLTA